MLDLKATPDLELARALCERADVVVSNFKPGTLERFGLDYEAVSRAEPGVVYCEISGFGERRRPRDAGLRPDRSGGRRADEHHRPARRRRRRRASRSSTSSRRSTRRSPCSRRSTRAATAAGAARDDRPPAARTWRCSRTSRPAGSPTGRSRGGSATFIRASSRSRPTAQRDGDLMIGAGNDGQFRAARGGDRCPGARRRSALLHQRGARRQPRRAAAAARGAAWGRGRASEWREALLGAGVPAGPVQTIDEAFSLAAELGLDVVDETDGVRTVAFPAPLSRDAGRPSRRRPPELDEHGDEIRRELISSSTPALPAGRENGQPSSARGDRAASAASVGALGVGRTSPASRRSGGPRPATSSMTIGSATSSRAGRCSGLRSSLARTW